MAEKAGEWRGELAGGTGRAGGRNWESWRAIGGEGGRVAGRVAGGQVVVILAALKWPEGLGERRGFPKDGWRGLFFSTHVGTAGSLEMTCSCSVVK